MLYLRITGIDSQQRRMELTTPQMIYQGINSQPRRSRLSGLLFYVLVSKKFVSFKKPMNPSKFQTHPAVLELFALCAIPAVSLKGRKNTSANNA